MSLHCKKKQVLAFSSNRHYVMYDFGTCSLCSPIFPDRDLATRYCKKFKHPEPEHFDLSDAELRGLVLAVSE